MDKDNGELQEAELVFQHHTYYVCMREAKGVTLSIEAERKSDGCRWRGDFTSRYIEEITQRVGNLKSFKTFVEMLKCAIFRKSSALHVDLLTYHDLEKLTVRRGAGDSHSAHSHSASASDKRYLILTYVTEFDRVHYPLPLIHEDNAEPEALKRCIQRLRSELDYMKAQVRKSDSHPRSPDITARASDQNGNMCHGESQVHGDPAERRGCSMDEAEANQRTIAKLLRKNSILMEEIRRAKDVEQRMAAKLQEQAFEIGLLKGRLSMRGVRDVSPAPSRSFRDISPVRSRPRLYPDSPSRPRLAKSPSLESRSATRKLASPSISQQGSSDDFRSRLLSHSRADKEKAEKLNRKISPRPRTMHAMSVEVEEIDSRLYALCNYLKSSHGK
ncbi:hypothetical protein AXG93_369s1100 [Marchantia polymorpha subsp. ruderalis]|uniref:Coiled-coil domain-containing protein 61 n=1 Tax=Marchantia polymorpha subsp. ruderalis TaxID=1480154 RepID=A0A176VVB5_MARPO|nr:hypothetical protein AXG93_369s1100 [Marchantia polymorpha subsp. ruderalis]